MIRKHLQMVKIMQKYTTIFRNIKVNFGTTKICLYYKK